MDGCFKMADFYVSHRHTTELEYFCDAQTTVIRNTKHKKPYPTLSGLLWCLIHFMELFIFQLI